MDDRRFDTLAQTLARGKSRRGVLKGLFAGAAGGALGLFGQGALAAPGGNGGGGGSKKTDCICCPSSTPTICGDTTNFAQMYCANLVSDANNCGSCGHVCSFPNAAATCSNGTCVMETCNAGFANCDGNSATGCEVNTQTDPSNCGGCGQTCASGEFCSAGGCVSCASDACNIATFDSQTGACTHTPLPDGTACGTNMVCLGGVCTTVSTTCVPGDTQSCYDGPSGSAGTGICQAGSQTCQPDGTWGECVGQVLPQPETCNGKDNNCDGVIDTAGCSAGQLCCPTTGGCVDPNTDPNNCGGCGISCGSNQGCINGICTSSCPPGTTLCNGVCVDLSTNVQNCGSCGNVCSFPNATAVCSAGVCGIAACDPGYADCDGNPANGCETDTLTDPSNCGGCEITCAPGQYCSGGTCAICDDGNVCTADVVDIGTGTCSHSPEPFGFSCGPDSCNGSTMTSSICDGAGTCVQRQVDCSPYMCGGNACLTTCADDSQCVSTAFCSGGACVPKV